MAVAERQTASEGEGGAGRQSVSPLRLRLRRFRRIKRGYYSFLILAGAYLLSFLLPFLMNDRALVVRYQGDNTSKLNDAVLASQDHGLRARTSNS